MRATFFLMATALLLGSCVPQQITPEDVPDKMRTYVQDIHGGSNFLNSKAWVYDWKTNKDGSLEYISTKVIPVRFITPTYVMDDIGNQFTYCFEFDVWMKSRESSELREVHMDICNQAIKEKRESAIGFNAWVRRVVWGIN